MSGLTHLDAKGRAQMVDVSAKDVTLRLARAQGRVSMQAETLAMIDSGGHKKGDVLSVARIAGIQAAKKCSELIPLCHPLALSSIEVEIKTQAETNCVDVVAACKVESRTGVEMEALTAVSVACLTIYDMCKAVDREMCIEDIRLLEKQGGASGDYQHKEASPQ